MVASTDHIVACVLGFVILCLVVGVLAVGVTATFVVFLLVNGGRTRRRRESPFPGEKLMTLLARLSLRPVAPPPWTIRNRFDLDPD